MPTPPFAPPTSPGHLPPVATGFGIQNAMRPGNGTEGSVSPGSGRRTRTP